MATDDRRVGRLKPSYPRKSSVTLPPVIPRSQYAGNAQSNNLRPGTGDGGPKYFSSPYRAPLNPRERQQSLLEHQKSISSVHSQDVQSPPSYPFHDERSSYAILGGPGPAIESVPIVMRTNSPMRYRDSSAVQTLYDDQGPGVVRQASIGHKAKPALTTVKRSPSTRDQNATSTPETPGNVAANALHAAFASAFNQKLQQHGQNSIPETTDTSRRRFGSPTSSYSQETLEKNQYDTIISVGHAEKSLKPSLSSISSLSTPPHDSGRVSPLSRAVPNSEKSASSTNPLIGLGIEQSKAKSRNLEKQRPPRLDMDAVRKAEARGSITSLPDLIRRATRLAANLDHGRTASTFSVFDMFRSYDKGNAGNRRSTHSDMNDMLAAFPKPTHRDIADPRRPTTMWPSEKKGEVFVNEESVGGSAPRRRRCCGLSTTTIVVVIVVVVVLCAAAVVLPIFLVVIPNQHHSVSDPRKCLSTLPCHNGGISFLDNNVCSCVCVDGFTGNDCSSPMGPSCATADSGSYHNATVGDLVMPLLADASTKFNIPLNTSAIFSVFAKENLSCTAENSLVRFQSEVKQQKKRFLPYHETPQEHWGHSTRTQQAAPQRIPKEDTVVILARQTSVQTTDNIVYETTSSQGSTTPTSSPTATSSSAAATYTSASTGGNVTDTIPPDQLEFAKVVVLYVLSVSRTPSIAVLAQQSMEQYFRAGGLRSGNDTVGVMNGEEHEMVADFANLTIVLGNGSVVGGGNQTAT